MRTIDGIDQTNFQAMARTAVAELVATVSPGNLIFWDAPLPPVAESFGLTNYYAYGTITSSNTVNFYLPEGVWRLHADVYGPDSGAAAALPA